MISKILYLLKQQYNPYSLYWFDLVTERHLKNRIGECIDCIECCKHIGGGHCVHASMKDNRCMIYHKRTCNKWFPVSQKEIDYRTEIQPEFKCKFKFK